MSESVYNVIKKKFLYPKLDPQDMANPGDNGELETEDSNAEDGMMQMTLLISLGNTGKTKSPSR